jgi:integration host factor subunit alpha
VQITPKSFDGNAALAGSMIEERLPGLLQHAGLSSPDDTLTKAELADLLFEVVGLNKREAKEVVDIFFEEIRETLVAGTSVKLSGFGNFQLRDKPQRPGRNPKTGEAIPIAARRVVTFHASQKLKSFVQDPSKKPLAEYADDDAAGN